MARVGVVGHAEVVDLAPVDRVPAAGAIVRAGDAWREAGGGGGVVAVVLRELAGAALLVTAVGDDADGAWLTARLRERHGVEVAAAVRGDVATTRALAQLDADGERTITVLGPLFGPSGDDAALPWDAVAALDGVFFCAGDAAALRRARAARVLVATPFAGPVLAAAGVELDVLVGSAGDDADAAGFAAAAAGARVVVRTDGARGGTWTARDGTSGGWDATPLPGPPVDAFGCGDAFAAALTLALAGGASIEDACAAGARAGAHRRTLRGPYG
jgi:ribokinase